MTAKVVAEYLETLRVTEGELAGEAFSVRPFQRRFIGGFLRNRHSALSMARGNGKTTLCAALGLAGLNGPLAVPRGQVAVVATTFSQAKVLFHHALWFLRTEVGDDLDKRRLWRKTDNNHESSVENRDTGASLRAYGSDPDAAHGLAPVLAICDEPAKWKANKSNQMYLAIRTALGKQPGGRLIAIGTRPDDPDHWFSRLLDGGPSIYAQNHYARDKHDKYSLAGIRQANPLWRWSKELRDVVLEEREQAKAMGGIHVSGWNALRINRGTPETEDVQPIVTLDSWRACETTEPPMPEGPVAVGFDLGGAASMTCACAYWPEPGLLMVRGAFPAEPDLQERGEIDGVGERYLQMERHGELRTYPGKVTAAGRFLQDFAEMIGGYELIGVAADVFRRTEAQQAIDEAGVAWDVDWRRVGRGSDGSFDVGAFQSEVLEARVRMRPSPMMTSAIRESRLTFDTNGNKALNKQRQRGRIDALQAAVIAAGIARRWRFPEKQRQLSASDLILHELYA